MKNKINALLCVMLFAFSVQAQEYQYQPIVTDDDVVWSYCDAWQGADEHYLYYYQLHFVGDTIINDMSYKKLFKSECGNNTVIYLAAMRETDKKIYVVKDHDTEESLAYNFNLNEGDVVSRPLTYSVTKIETVEINGKLRKKFIFDNGYDVWIEGVGSLIHRFLPFPLDPYPLYDYGLFLNYQKKDGVITYKTDEFFFKEDECSTNGIELLSVQSTTISQTGKNIYRIDSHLIENFHIQICRVSGEILLQKEIKSGSQIDLNHFSAGIYLIVVNNIVSYKIIK